MNDKDIIKTINDIVWWIPFKKLRNQVRKLLIYYIEQPIKERRLNELTLYNEDNYYKKEYLKKMFN